MHQLVIWLVWMRGVRIYGHVQPDELSVDSGITYYLSHHVCHRLTPCERRYRRRRDDHMLTALETVPASSSDRREAKRRVLEIRGYTQELFDWLSVAGLDELRN